MKKTLECHITHCGNTNEYDSYSDAINEGWRVHIPVAHIGNRYVCPACHNMCRFSEVAEHWVLVNLPSRQVFILKDQKGNELERVLGIMNARGLQFDEYAGINCELFSETFYAEQFAKLHYVYGKVPQKLHNKICVIVYFRRTNVAVRVDGEDKVRIVPITALRVQ